MNETASSTMAFEAERDRLFGLAYRMTGSVVEAEDIVQDAWLRWQTQRPELIDNPAAWLTTVATRLALDRLTSARARREQYVGPWLPEPVERGSGPDASLEQAETLTLGFLCVLDRLEPRERAAFLLHDVFDRSHAEIAEALDLSEGAARQVASRARRRVRDEHRSGRGDRSREGELVGAFLDAAVAGDEDRLIDLLTADAVWLSDGGAQRHAARRPIVGATRIARFVVNLTRRAVDSYRFRRTYLNGEPALVVETEAGEVYVAAAFEVEGDRIVAVRSVLNPDKHRGLKTPEGGA